MRISEALNIHGGLVSLAGGPGLPAKLGKYNYGVIKNIRKLEQDVIKPFQEARQKVIQEQLALHPGFEQLPEDDRRAINAEMDALIAGLLDEDADFTPHLMDAGVLELCSVGEAHAILALVKEE